MAADNNRDWRVDVDADRCIGAGMCTALAAARFRISGNRSQPVDALIGEDDAVLDASESCPVEAITVRDASTGELLAPVEGEGRPLPR
ncbi:ferredoxin [Actinomadura sp. NAK00032]|uniref:ferredoxin n=1 Tax=Actinomadura sp. NAK00032 TaxID=2742128 RepID=UPI001591A9C3|nr:ferredoxin [Actinomadura sp. NAK00032]QKW35612.1 ferredoxin [Actinomadura sp. NAK00032]